VAGVAGRVAARSPARALLAGAIDYAGLFPPAALPMTDAVRSYAAYRASDDAWALGRFVVPAARLAEFRDAALPLLRRAAAPWPLSILAGAGGINDWTDASRVAIDGAALEALELRATTPGDVAAAKERLSNELEVFFEIPIDEEPRPLVEAVARAGSKAKVRTGGVTEDAFPSAADLARFIVRCAETGVPFKATAGLHHPLRARYRLTYQPDSPTGEMFGFVNVVLAAAIAYRGSSEQTVVEMLDESDASAIRFDASGVVWRGERVSTEELARTRMAFALSFGSCSFREPIDELQALNFL
jgi:hypothetical protein